MRLLVDAQLPLRLVHWFLAAGHDAIHTSQLPNGNRTSDSDLARIADADGRLMVTKDRDFEIGHLLHDVPRRLLLVSTGNIKNSELLDLFAEHIGMIAAGVEHNAYIEISSTTVIAHGRPER
jgi:predicted nuclease of predicted toxin-antitoxin system